MSAELIKNIWPEWSVLRRIGGGAYGTVFEVVRNEYGVENHAAIKVISIPESQAEIDTFRAEGLTFEETKAHFQEIVNEFVNEIKLMLSLEGCPNVVNIRDYKVVKKSDSFGWNIFLLMELLTPFAEYANGRQLSEREVIRLGCDICTALEICAKENIIHRDVKPGNILVHKSGAFKLGDFGIARKLENMTNGLSSRYTPKYMAPEVATSQYYDARVDIYSLGIVLYELMNERCIPFQPNKQVKSMSDIEMAVRRRNSGERLPPPRMASPAMADLILRACAHNPDMRFASATEMKQALIMVANGTYQAPAAKDPNRTVSVRKKPANYNQTSAVRRPPANSAQRVGGPSANAMNSVPRAGGPSANAMNSAPKKRSKFVVILVSVLIAALILTVGVIAAVKMLDSNDKEDSNRTSKRSTKTHTTTTTPSTAPSSVYTTAPPINATDTTALTTTATTTAPTSTTTSAVAATSAPTELTPVKNVSSDSIIGASSSSFLSEPDIEVQHTADRVLDGKLETSWVEGAYSDGIGEYLTIYLDKEYVVSGLTICPGYQKSSVLFERNSRPCKIQIIFSDGSYYNSTLDDAMKAQTINFNRSVVTSSVTIKILSVYNGSVFDDTAIAEVSLF